MLNKKKEFANPIITVNKLSKNFRFPVKSKAKSWLRNLISPDHKTVHAVTDVSFEINKGESVAFIGPNGAGKSTTIKMLTGVLLPSSGEIRVLGLNPSKQRKELAYKIGPIFGQRSQLLPNLPPVDSFRFNGLMYGMDNDSINSRIDQLTELFDLFDFINQPVRKLSLGQRMRIEIAASIIHKPDIVMLDEPTIGLDIVAKQRLRDLLNEINSLEGTTVFLTSHDVGDIESICDRTIIINEGKILIDSPTKQLALKHDSEKHIQIKVQNLDSIPDLPNGILLKEESSHKKNIEFKVNTGLISTTEAMKFIFENFQVSDINIKDTDLESIIRNAYENV